MPNRSEAAQIFGSSTDTSEVPLVYEAVAHSDSEENNSVELMMQTASSTELGFEGLAIQELVGSMAYNSAFNQLCVLVQSSNTLPPELEERCLRWVEQFR